MADFKMVLPVLLAFVISVILGPIIIPYLKENILWKIQKMIIKDILF